ncbi:MAG: hypothetical protein AABY87_05060 [bacterium]
MTFIDVVKNMLASTSEPITPQETRELIKKKFPQYYGTPSHISNVAKGHYKDLDHALLAQIYGLVRMNRSFFCDKTHKPMKISLKNNKARPKLRPEIPQNEDNMRNEDDLIKNIGHYYKRSLEVMKEFGGPSIYFHVQAIKERETSFLSDRHIEMIYATLASWGMHKMGDPDITKAKMVEFPEFKQSIIKHRDTLQQLSSLRMDSCSQEQYGKHIDDLEQIYYTLKVSISKATIVAHSKTLAHILPNLVTPIDRQYTIRFFTQENKDFFTESGKYRLVNLPQGIVAQFVDFKKYCCRMKMLFDRCDHQLFTIDKETFNTSLPKIMDNLIMAFIKDVPKPDKNERRK